VEIFEKIIYSEAEVLDKIEISLEKKQSLLVTYFNVHCYNIYKENKNYRSILNDDFRVYTDGTGMWLMMKKLGKFYHRFNATDLNFRILKMLENKSSKVFFVGSKISSDVIDEKFCRSEINFCGYLNGFDDESELISKVTECQPDLVLIGMGVPKQEFFASKLSNNLSNSVIVCTGNFFEFYFETQQRAPYFLRKFGMEWLYRLYLEPRRLLKRYTVENFLFLFDLIKIKKS